MDELSFGPGECIQVLQMPEGGWYEGKLRGEVGWFPASHAKKVASERESQHIDIADYQKAVWRYQIAFMPYIHSV